MSTGELMGVVDMLLVGSQVSYLTRPFVHEHRSFTIFLLVEKTKKIILEKTKIYFIYDNISLFCYLYCLRNKFKDVGSYKEYFKIFIC